MKTLILSAILSLGLITGDVLPVHSQTPTVPDYLNKAAVMYGSSEVWSNQAMRDWTAKNYDMIIGTGDAAGITYMKSKNPDLKVLVYELIFRMAPDTVDLKQWCQSKGYNFEDFVIRIKAGDSVNTRPADQGTYFINFQKTVGPNIMLTSGYNPAQLRFTWDFREPKIGEYLVYKWNQSMAAKNCDGVLADEDGIIGFTNNYTGGLYPLFAPFKDVTPSFWAYGSPYTSFTRPWGNTFDLEDANTTHSYVDIRDSLRRARNGWLKVAGDLMKGSGKILGTNWAGVPGNTINNWTNEGRHSAVLQGAYIAGEYSYFNPSTDGQEASCLNGVKMCADIADSNVTMIVGWISTGQFPLAGGVSFSRSKMNALGFMLDCLHPGNSKYYFATSRQNGQVNYDKNPTVNGVTAPDTLTLWSYAFKKAYGVPTKVRTVTTGTDPAGQSYSLRSLRLNRTDGVLQTYAVGRYTKGANVDVVATAVPVTLPQALFEVQENGTYTGPVTSTTIANAQWKIFVADTSAANKTGVVVQPPPPPVTPKVDTVKIVDTVRIRITDTLVKIKTDTLIRMVTDTVTKYDTVCPFDIIIKPRQ